MRYDPNKKKLHGVRALVVSLFFFCFSGVFVSFLSIFFFFFSSCFSIWVFSYFLCVFFAFLRVRISFTFFVLFFLCFSGFSSSVSGDVFVSFGLEVGKHHAARTDCRRADKTQKKIPSNFNRRTHIHRARRWQMGGVRLRAYPVHK